MPGEHPEYEARERGSQPRGVILVVEDSPTDLLLVKQALSEANLSSDLHVVSDGVEATAFLRRQGRYADAPRPDLVLLDLNLPRKSGREVLADVKRDPALCAIPIIVLTTSPQESEILAAYELHANCLVTKPVDYVAFSRVVQAIGEFWLCTVRLPPRT